MKNTLALAFIFLAFSANAQLKNVSIGMNGNLPLIPSVQETAVPVTPIPGTGFSSFITTTLEIEERFSEQAGIGFRFSADYDIGRKFFFSSGLMFDYLRFHRKIMIVSSTLQQDNYEGMFGPVTPGVPIGSIYWVNRLPSEERYVFADRSDVGKTTMMMMQIPALVGKSFLRDKLIVKAGAAASFLLNATQYQDAVSFPNGFSVEKVSTTKPFNTTSFSALVQGRYKIFPKISVDVSAQRFFTPLYQEDYRSGGKAKMNLFSLGVSYSLKN